MEKQTISLKPPDLCGLGILMRNEHLLTSTFQFSCGFYPFLPGHAVSLLVYNLLRSFTL